MSLKDIDKPIDKRLEPIKDLEFVIDEEIKKTLLELFTIQQMLEKEKLNKSDKKMLEKHKSELIDIFRIKLQQLNPTQTAIVRAFLKGEKNKRDKQVII